MSKEGKLDGDAPYTPSAVLSRCAHTGASWLPANAIETLLSGLLVSQPDPLFDVFTRELADYGMLGTHLAGVLIRTASTVSVALDTLSTLVAAGELTSGEAMNVDVALLEAWGWNEETQPIIETLARRLMQNPGLVLPRSLLERMLQTAAATRDESSARAAALRLLDTQSSAEDDALVGELQRVFSLLAWSSTARTAVLGWWRAFVQVQSTARLTRLVKAMEGTRVTEDALQSLRSAIAMRRLTGKRDVATFAADVNTAYTVLEMLAEAFEPGEKGANGSFEPETVRAVLAHMAEELSPHDRQILSNSLKGLAGLIAQMGDSRSKAGLGRSSDNLDRQFLRGEQTPQSAVDAMKWIAGFFAGSQGADE